MSESRRDRSPILPLAVGIGMLLLLVIGYVGAYRALVVRTLVFRPPAQVIPVAGYRFGGTAAAMVFGPAHRLDRMIRPDYWR